MNSVMYKLLGKEDNKMSADSVSELATGANISDASIDDIHSKETEAALERDAHNLVTNTGIGRKEDIFMQLKGGETLSVIQESRFGKLRPSKDGLIWNKANSQKRQKTGPAEASEVTANKRAHPVLSDKIAEDEVAAVLPRNISSEGHAQETKIFAEPPPNRSQIESGTNTSQSTKGHSWIQKSSWRDLVGDMGNSSFSISSVLPGIGSVSPKLLKSNDSAIVISIAARKT